MQQIYEIRVRGYGINQLFPSRPSDKRLYLPHSNTDSSSGGDSSGNTQGGGSSGQDSSGETNDDSSERHDNTGDNDSSSEDSSSDDTSSKITELAAPKIWLSDDGMLEWDAVPNAAEYCLTNGELCVTFALHSFVPV